MVARPFARAGLETQLRVLPRRRPPIGSRALVSSHTARVDSDVARRGNQVDTQFKLVGRGKVSGDPALVARLDARCSSDGQVFRVSVADRHGRRPIAAHHERVRALFDEFGREIDNGLVVDDFVESPVLVAPHESEPRDVEHRPVAVDELLFGSPSFVENDIWKGDPTHGVVEQPIVVVGDRQTSVVQLFVSVEVDLSFPAAGEGNLRCDKEALPVILGERDLESADGPAVMVTCRAPPTSPSNEPPLLSTRPPSSSAFPERLLTNPFGAVRFRLDASADASSCCATNSYGCSTRRRLRTSRIRSNTARIRNFYGTVPHMTTGADRYFERRAAEPGFVDAYDAARRKIDQIDRLVRALDDRRETLGMSKAELARRADLAPEVVRRLFSADSPNPTIGTLTALADSLGLELVPQKQHAS